MQLLAFRLPHGTLQSGLCFCCVWLPPPHKSIADVLASSVQEAPIYIFVAIVPVTMDAYFKLWIFRGLNRKNPAAAVTLKSMDRH